MVSNSEVQRKWDLYRIAAFGDLKNTADSHLSAVRDKGGLAWLGMVAWAVVMNNGLGLALGPAAIPVGIVGTILTVGSAVSTGASLSGFGARELMERFTTVQITVDGLVDRIQKKRVLDWRSAAAYALYSRIRAETGKVSEEDGNFIRGSMRILPPFSEASDEKAEKQTFLANLADCVGDHHEANPWFRAATKSIHPYVIDLVAKGLSDELVVGQTEHNVREVASQAQWLWNGQERCTPREPVQWRVEKNIPYFCISYQHSYKHWVDWWRGTISEASLRESLDAIEKYIRENGLGSRYRVWIDRLMYGVDERWATYGLVPYLLFPTYQTRGSWSRKGARGSHRTWIMLETVCALAGPGMVNPDESMPITVMKRFSLLEAWSSVAEIIRKSDDKFWRQMNQFFREENESSLRAWAEGILYCRELREVYARPRQITENEIPQPNVVMRYEKRFNYMPLYFVSDVAQTKAVEAYMNSLQQDVPKNGWNYRMLLHVSEKDLDIQWFWQNSPIRDNTKVDVLQNAKGRTVLRLFTNLREGAIQNCLYVKSTGNDYSYQVLRVVCTNGKPDWYNSYTAKNPNLQDCKLLAFSLA